MFNSVITGHSLPAVKKMRMSYLRKQIANRPIHMEFDDDGVVYEISSQVPVDFFFECDPCPQIMHPSFTSNGKYSMFHFIWDDMPISISGAKSARHGYEIACSLVRALHNGLNPDIIFGKSRHSHAITDAQTIENVFIQTWLHAKKHDYDPYTFNYKGL